MTVLVCPGCNEPLDLSPSATSCPHCGHALAPLDSPASENLEPGNGLLNDATKPGATRLTAPVRPR